MAFKFKFKINRRPKDNPDGGQMKAIAKTHVQMHHELLVYGYVRSMSNASIASVQQLVHEFYHKNRIVYQQAKDDSSTEEYASIKVGGAGGGAHKYVSEKRELLTHLVVATLYLYNERGISIQGYRFESNRNPSRCNMGHPPEGISAKKTIEIQSNSKKAGKCYINGVEIYYGGSHDGIRGIKLSNNRGKSIMIGDTEYNGKRWKRTTVNLPHLQYGIIGFQGRSGWLLDQICFIFAPQ
mmetsp:Transcript_13791/g.21612  ORF Transcript_13791/g.21612 Transcript_13791/m.21612 type:complete len:239 (-) Transcript_13791:8-724(-)